jgi:hypothetical protein
MSRKSRNLSNFLVLLLVAPFAFQVHAQAIYGSASGTVHDSSGAVIVKAAVTATNSATGQTITTRSNESGRWVFPSLTVGTYVIKVESPGFKKVVNTHTRANLARTHTT